MEHSDEELVAKAKKNDRRAFEDLVNRHQKMVFNLAYRMLGNREDAKDAAQDSFIRLYHSIAKFRGQAKFTTWLYRIVSNVCLSKLSASAARQSFIELDAEAESVYSEASDWEDTPENILLKEESKQTVRDLVRLLPPAYRAVITLYHLEWFSYAEIAQILDLPEGTVKTHLFRAREALKKAVLNKYQQGEI